MASPPADPTHASPPISGWLDRFFESYYRHRPVNATFIGVHAHDARLPDLSKSGVGDTVAEMQALSSASANLQTATASPVELLDLRLAQGFLRIQSWEYESSHFNRGNPSLYTGEAVFGVMSLFLNHAGALQQRVESAIARMEAIPGFLDQGRHNVTSAPAPWVDRAIRECDGALAFLTSGVQSLAADEGISEPGLLTAAATAADGFRGFRSHLSAGVRPAPAATAACGDEALAMYLEDGHFLAESAEEILRYADSQMAEASAYLAEHAADFGANTQEEALAQLSAVAPTADSYLGLLPAVVGSGATDRNRSGAPDVAGLSDPLRATPAVV